jgi:hypothetical protein
LGASTAHSAQIVFSDDMNYESSAAMQAAWLPAFGVSGGANPALATNATFTPTNISSQTPAPASGAFMSLANGARYRSLGGTLTGDWSLDVKMLHNSYTRYQSIFLLNEAGTEGYGLAWSGTNVDQNGGRGLVQIVKFSDFSYSDYNSFSGGTTIGGSANSGQPVTGYTVTGTPGGSAQNSATFDTSSWADFLDLRLEWKATTRELTLYSEGVQVRQTTDTDFSEFSRVYVRGNTTTYFDSIVVTTVPEPGVLAFVIPGLLGVLRGRKRRPGSI